MTVVSTVALVLIGAVAVVLLLPSVSDLLSLIAIAVGRGTRVARTEQGSARFLFMIPAHDEELLIGRCLESFQHLDYSSDSYDVVVVADNCTDRTAELARAAGVHCLERHDPDLRGKPHAIAWALERFDLSEYDAMVIVDGDTLVDPGYCRAMSKVVDLRVKAAQAYNGISNPDENALTRMGFVLGEAYYRFMYPLKQRAGLNPPLTGAGMCIGAGSLEEHGWSAFSLSEDVEMYVRLTLAGVRTECVADARVYSQGAASLSDSDSQRQRWRAGRLTILGRLGPSVMTRGVVGFRQRLDLISELAAPGPAVHLGLVVLLAPVAFLLPLSGGARVAAALLASIVRPLVYSGLALAVDEQPGRAVRAFLFLPLYTGWRLLTEARAVLRIGNSPWVRTARREGTRDRL